MGKAVISGHGHFRSFSKWVGSFWAIVNINIYLYYTIDDLFSPETKMTGNDHDRKWPEYNPHSDGR